MTNKQNRGVEVAKAIWDFPDTPRKNWEARVYLPSLAPGNLELSQSLSRLFFCCCTNYAQLKMLKPLINHLNLLKNHHRGFFRADKKERGIKFRALGFLRKTGFQHPARFQMQQFFVKEEMVKTG